MSQRKVARYGTWTSPILPEDFAHGTVMLDQVYVNQINGKIYLLEIRPDEGGRGCIAEFSESGSKDVLPKEFNALTQVHEYGGASFVVREADGFLIFSDFKSKVVYELNPETAEVRPIVEEDRKIYFADFDVHPADPKWVASIREDHHPAKIEEIKNTLVVIDSTTKAILTIAKGADFYAFPRFSPNGKQICWTQWSHPNMPWNYTELLVADWQDGKISNEQIVAGREAKASVTQPQWSPDGSLFFADDRTGYWQLYHLNGGSTRQISVKGLESAEFAVPDWFLGCSTYAPLTKDTLVASYNMDGSKKAIVIDVMSGEYTDPGFPINDVAFNALKRTSDTSFAVIGSTATAPQSFFHLDITKPSKMHLLKESVKVNFRPTYFAPARNIKFPRNHGPGGGYAYGIFFLPTNPEYAGPKGTLPPLVVAMHGGPTSQEGPGVSMSDQFWTTRGYALVQVNYVGSSGYGKEYINLLNGHWGVSDIADAVSCVEYLIKEGLIDPKRVGIIGHSAGGYATMQALCKFPNIWAAGIAESGISDMQAMFDQTHKFESRYMQPLCFEIDATQADRKRIIKERSPIHWTQNIKAPMLILSGEVDEIVPPNQAHLMAEKIKAGGGTVEVCVYDGEGHDFVKGSNLEDMAIRREAWFRKYLVDK